MSDQDQEPRGPWRFIRLDQFHLPPEATREKMRRGILGVWDRLTGGRLPAESPAVEMDLEVMPGDLLAEAAPPPDWGDGVSALQVALEDWWKERSGKMQIVVGAPYSGTAEIVSHWASVFQCPVLPEPSLDQIKAGGTQWLEEIDTYPDRVWVIPRLERCYLRHSQGFALLRTLLDKITTSSTRFLLACDSWAWAYLSKALHIDALFPMPLILEAFDREKLERWLGGLAARTQGKPFIFRQANNKKLVLHKGEGAQEEGEKQEDVSDFLPRLATYSRGIPGVAHTFWRYSLRIAQTKKNQENQEKPPGDSDDDGHHRIIWVEPWSALNFPSLAGISSRDRDLFILHTLLLQNGLPSRVLAKVLPFPESQIKSMLQVLRIVGIVVSDQENWRVAASAYPAVREFLQYEGYLKNAL
jgi:hypothetical protein